MKSAAPWQLLDGPLGTELYRRGVRTELPLWSAGAIADAPEAISAVHADYAAAGATIHTTNTFRTQERTVGSRWVEWTKRAVKLCRDAVPRTHRVAGSIAPLEDCYRPDLSPPDALKEHRAMAEILAKEGCDLLLCETFPHPGEALAAVRAAIETGTETWLSLTAGPEGDLLSPNEVYETALRAADLGASTVLINCTALGSTGPFVEALARTGLPFGAYANAGHPDEEIGWNSATPNVDAYAAEARRWIEAGASVIGGCCGTSPVHTAALRALVSGP
ncbi:MAG: homocysteine S-methyltransferase family protein [Myxococcota bacterium]